MSSAPDRQETPRDTNPDGTAATRYEGRDTRWQLATESIALKIRWFGLIIGYLLVNFLSPNANQPMLNGILTLGAVYAIIDLVWNLRSAVFLVELPLFISLMEAVFIGLLCHFDRGLDSPFRFYYFLSLLLVAIRYSPTVTYATFALHACSYATLALTNGVSDRQELVSLTLMLVFMGWVTWASTALTMLLKQTGRELTTLNAQLEQRIMRRTRELQESQALIVQQEKQAAFGLLAAGIAHEVGNPLAAISSLVQMMNRKPLPDEMHDRLGLIDEQLRRIQRTLRELIQFSRPGTNEFQQCHIHDIIDNALSIAKYYKRKKGRSISIDYGENVPPVTVIRDQWVQVFLNLVLNALDATEEGGKLQICTRCEDGHVEVLVKDSGSGIPETYREHLFEPYFTTKPTGTGLGLFVCRNIVESSQGEISLLSSGPTGTDFLVRIPASTATSGPLDA